MIKKQPIYITPFKEERMLHIYVPDKIKKDIPIAVMYMFDGHNLFYDDDATYHKSWGLKDYLDENKCNLYVVGIECNHVGNKRLCEFSPYSFIDDIRGEVTGLGKDLLTWMVKELKPWFENQYNIQTTKENTYIAGSSMGGLMALYGGCKHYRTFGKAICISLFYLHVHKRLYNEIETMKSLNKNQFYLSWGQHEYDSQEALAIASEINLRFARLLTSKNAQVYCHCYEDGGHNEASWEKEIPHFMKELNIQKG